MGKISELIENFHQTGKFSEYKKLVGHDET